MHQLGFDDRWVALTIEYIRSVSYSVLINGLPYGNIKPTRGLRQGDAMSPYLFLLCGEVLSQMLDYAQHTNQLQGMKLARRCPTISHLFFADAFLFFCRATLQDVTCLASIFEQYERISGQKVNYDKSSIIFGKRIDTTVRARIHQVLKILSVEGGGKYLGLPEQFSRSKVSNFHSVVQSMKKQLSPWYNQYLSPTGKEI